MERKWLITVDKEDRNTPRNKPQQAQWIADNLHNLDILFLSIILVFSIVFVTKWAGGYIISIKIRSLLDTGLPKVLHLSASIDTCSNFIKRNNEEIKSSWCDQIYNANGLSNYSKSEPINHPLPSLLLIFIETLCVIL